MLVKSFTALAALALAAQVVAEPMPYKPKIMKVSVQEVFGVVRRSTPGYQPTQAMCGTGETCEEACGAGYTTCASNDDEVHCFNPSAKEVCCPNQTGDSCDAGYYCTSDTKDETWCCPEGMDTVACAAAYSVSGGLVVQTAKPTSSAAPSSSVPAKNVTSSYKPTGIPTLPTGGFPGTNKTTNPTFGAPTATPTNIQQGAGSMVAPSLFGLVAAGIAALL